jgi:predicted ester cyclase
MHKSENQNFMKNFFFLLILLGLFAACSNMGNSNAGGDKEAANKARVQEFYDQVFNAHNINMIDSFCTANFVDHNPDEGHNGQGLADLKSQFTSFFGAYPDIHATTHFMVAQGDTVVAHINFTGTNTGPMGPGMPATNKKMSIDGIDIIAIKDGKAVERWGFFDTMKMMKDMGMMPSPPPADTTKAADASKTMEKKK